MNKEPRDDDLALAGAALDAYAPVGLPGLIIGGVLAAVVLAVSAIRRAWSRAARHGS